MNFPLFISQRIQQADKRSFSATVTKIGIASITLGLSVMIVSFGILFGFKDTIRQKLFSLSGHAQVKKFSANESLEANPLSTQTKLFNSAKNIPEIAHLQAIAQKGGILKTKENILGIVLKGVGKDYDWSYFAPNLSEGKIPVLSDTSASKEILISRSIANKMDIKIGENVLVYFLQNPPRVRSLKVSGIYETGLEEFDKNLLIGDIRLIQKLNNWGADSVGSYQIYVKDFDNLEASAKKIYDAIDHDMALETVTQQYPQIFDWLQLLDRNMAIFLPLILFVACFNMVSILLVMMMERSPMIGLLKALGSPNWQIRKVFLFNGIWMIIRGIAYGNLLGIGLCLLQKHFQIIPLDPASYYMNTVPIVMNWGVILMLNLATFLLVVLVLVIPTFVITRIQPVKAIAFKK